jgi:adenylyltransferase/sulfurtransferase
VRPSRPQQLRFDELGPRLRAVGEVSWNEFLLRLSLAGAELTLFPDGRAIVKGTDDPATARALYARYVGY